MIPGVFVGLARGLAQRRRGLREGRQYALDRDETERDRLMNQTRLTLAEAANRRAEAEDTRATEDQEYQRSQRTGRARSAGGYRSRYPDLESVDDEEAIYQGRRRDELQRRKEESTYESTLPARPSRSTRPPDPTPNSAGNDAAIERKAGEIYRRLRREAMNSAAGATAQERATAVRAQEAELRARALEDAANDFAARGVITPDVAARYRRRQGGAGQAGKLTVETQDEYDALRRSMPDSAISSRYNVARGIQRRP